MSKEQKHTEEHSYGLTVKIPISQIKVGNLTNLLEAKGYLIKKALGVDDIRFKLEEESISFPWFEADLNEAEQSAYLNFITAICRMSREQKRINAKEKKAENEKYAFRCFLLRLGFIGDEYKQDRKILLRNLNGSSAFSSVSSKKEPLEPKMKLYRVELDDDNFKIFEARDEFEALNIGDRIAEELGSDFCNVMEDEE